MNRTIHTLSTSRTALILLLATLLTATAAQTAWAQSSFSGGSGTQADPYKISSSADLVQLATDINNSTSRLYEDQYFVQTGNINMSGINFVPIGINDDNNHRFRGKYNGQNYTISNLTVNGSYDYAGLFGYIYNGDIDNVRLVSPSITNTKTSYTGALVGFGNMPGIHHCVVINPTLSGGNSIGVFAGGQYAGNIKYTYYTGNNNYSNVGNTIGSNANTSIGHAYALTLSGGATTSTTAAFTYNSTDYYAGTITLSNAAPAGWIYAYTVNGSPIDGTSFTINADATVALSRTPDPAHFSVNGDGSYTIKTATGWNVFCDCLDDNDTYNRFSGKTVKLGADITVTRMAGGDSHEFTGTFDGGGHTLTVNYANTGNDTRTAPFSYVDGATIQNLIVGGTISGTAYRAAGIIGETVNTTSHITNCVSNVDISSGRYTGGFSIGGNVEIEGCVFNGKINGTDRSGGFIGYSYSAQVIKNSLFAPQDGSSISGGTFYYNGGGDVAPVNSYYTQALGTAQGKACHSVTAGTDVTIEPIALTGTATPYTVSGITAYSGGGLQRGETLYYGSGDQLSLTLSNTATGAPQGYQYTYTASAGTLDGSTLTMPNENVTISVALLSTREPVTVAYIKADGTPGEASAIALDGTETTLAAGWYFVGKDISYPTTVTLTLGGDVHLILADDKTMNVTTTGDEHEDYCINAPDGHSLHIYGQTEGTGTLNAQTQGDADAVIHIEGGTLGIHGGNVTATVGSTSGNLLAIRVVRTTAGDALVIDRGTLTANGNNGLGIYIEGGDARINGGQVAATGASAGITVLDAMVDFSITIPGILTLSGGTLTASGFDTYSGESYAGTLAVASGHTYTDGTSLYDSATETATLAALGGKTLQPALLLADAADNTAAIADYAGQTLAVALSGRTLSKSGEWNTLCLPFAVSSEQLNVSSNPLNGATIKALDAANSNLSSYGTLTLTFAEATSIEAGKPYIVKWTSGEGTVSNPVFEDVTITATAPTAVVFANNATAGTCQFVGQFSPFTIVESGATGDNQGNQNEIILMGAGSKLGYAASAPRTLRSFRAHFMVPADGTTGAPVNGFMLDFGDGDNATGIISVSKDSGIDGVSDGWYSLDGRKLDGQPARKGVYIHGGRKVVVSR